MSLTTVTPTQLGTSFPNDTSSVLKWVCDGELGAIYTDGGGRKRIPARPIALGVLLDGNLSVVPFYVSSNPSPRAGTNCIAVTCGDSGGLESHTMLTNSIAGTDYPSRPDWFDQVGDVTWHAFSIFVPAGFTLGAGKYILFYETYSSNAGHGQGFGIYFLGSNPFTLAWGMLSGLKTGSDWAYEQNPGGGWGGKSLDDPTFTLPTGQWVDFLTRWNYQWRATGDLEMWAKATVRDTGWRKIIDQHGVPTMEKVDSAPGNYQIIIGNLTYETTAKTIYIDQIATGTTDDAVLAALMSPLA